MQLAFPSKPHIPKFLNNPKIYWSLQLIYQFFELECFKAAPLSVRMHFIKRPLFCSFIDDEIINIPMLHKENDNNLWSTYAHLNVQVWKLLPRIRRFFLTGHTFPNVICRNQSNDMHYRLQRFLVPQNLIDLIERNGMETGPLPTETTATINCPFTLVLCYPTYFVL